MFEKNSRYDAIDTATLMVQSSDGTMRPVVYKRRRLLPDTQGFVDLAAHPLSEGERLDGLAARYLNDATAFWRICDTNQQMNPDELDGQIGRVLRIAVPRT